MVGSKCCGFPNSLKGPLSRLLHIDPGVFRVEQGGHPRHKKAGLLGLRCMRDCILREGLQEGEGDTAGCRELEVHCRSVDFVHVDQEGLRTDHQRPGGYWDSLVHIAAGAVVVQ